MPQNLSDGMLKFVKEAKSGISDMSYKLLIEIQLFVFEHTHTITYHYSLVTVQLHIVVFFWLGGKSFMSG